MSDRVFRKTYELREHVAILKHSINECNAKKRELESDISSMSFRLTRRVAELERREKEEAQDKVDAAQRELDILYGKEVSAGKVTPMVCGKKCSSGYLPDCSYDRGHSGVCEGRYDEALVMKINQDKIDAGPK